MKPLTVIAPNVPEGALRATPDALRRLAAVLGSVEANRLGSDPSRSKAHRHRASQGSGLGWSWTEGTPHGATLWSCSDTMTLDLRIGGEGRALATILMAMPRNLKTLVDRKSLATLLALLAARIEAAVPMDHRRAVRILEKHRIICESMATQAGGMLIEHAPNQTAARIETPSPFLPQKDGWVAYDGQGAIRPTAAFRELVRQHVPSTIRIGWDATEQKMTLGAEADHVLAVRQDAIAVLRTMAAMAKLAKRPAPILAERVPITI